MPDTDNSMHAGIHTELAGRVARFFLVQTYLKAENIPNGHKLYQTAINYTKWP
jgi:hypothetical protein